MRDLIKLVLVVFVIAATGFGSVLADELGMGPAINIFDSGLGNEPTRPDCSILYFSASQFVTDFHRLILLGYNATHTVDPSDLAFANLGNYNVLVIWATGEGEIAAYQDDIEMFVSLGGSLFIHQMNVIGDCDYAPPGFELHVVDSFWCDGVYSTYIVDGGHELTLGLADADLSGDFDWTTDTGPGYTILARNTNCDSPSLGAGMYVGGKVVFDTGNFFAGGAYDPGSDAFILQLMDYLCDGGGVTALESGNWSRVKSMYR